MKTILVGNGPSLGGSGLGELIDSFDTVVRFNNFVTEGFERDLGSKITIWAVNVGLFHDIFWKHSFPRPRTIVYAAIEQQIREALSESGRFHAEPQPWWVSLIASQFVSGNTWPSTGVVAAIHHSPCSVVGFDGFDPSKPIHYFSNEHEIAEHHQNDVESAIMKMLVSCAGLEIL